MVLIYQLRLLEFKAQVADFKNSLINEPEIGIWYLVPGI